MLQAVAPWDEETLQQGLHRLVEAEFLYQRGLPPQATYVFKHALIHRRRRISPYCGAPASGDALPTAGAAPERAPAAPERPAKRRTGSRALGWCWTGDAGWDRVAPEGRPEGTASGAAEAC